MKTSQFCWLAGFIFVSPHLDTSIAGVLVVVAYATATFCEWKNK